MKNKLKKKRIYLQSNKIWVGFHPGLFDPKSSVIEFCHILRLQGHERRQIQQNFLAHRVLWLQGRGRA